MGNWKSNNKAYEAKFFKILLLLAGVKALGKPAGGIIRPLLN